MIKVWKFKHIKWDGYACSTHGGQSREYAYTNRAEVEAACRRAYPDATLLNDFSEFTFAEVELSDNDLLIER